MKNITKILTMFYASLGFYVGSHSLLLLATGWTMPLMDLGIIFGISLNVLFGG